MLDLEHDQLHQPRNLPIRPSLIRIFVFEDERYPTIFMRILFVD
jgi:hypothetical protein